MRTHILTLIALSGLAFSQGPDDDPPSRAARLSFLNGSVTFQPGGVEDWVPATLNRPLTTGDRLFTENNARAEMHVGSAAFRVAAPNELAACANCVERVGLRCVSQDGRN